MKKLALLGFDGLSYDFLMRHLNELPTFKSVVENGCCGVLDSVRPPITVPAFPCLATSKSPDYYGIYTFYSFNKETKELKLWKETKLKDRFWDILSDRGYKSILFNIPTSYPYKKDFRGSIVASGPEEGKKSYTYPPELWDELNEQVDGLKLEPTQNATDPGYIEEVTEIEEKRIRAIEHLLNNNNWNFTMTFLRQTDRIAHRWWHTDEVLKAYKRADRHLQRILKNDCDVIIYSDHGFQGLHRVINLSYILERAGLIKLKTKSPHKVVSAWARRSISSFARKHGFIGFLKRRTPQKILEKTPQGTDLSWFNVLMCNMIDFDKTYVVPVSAGKNIPLYVLKERDKVKETIEAELDKLGINYSIEERDSDNPRVPDLMLEASDDGYFFHTRFDAKESISKVKMSTHDRRGVVIASGKNFKEGKIYGARLIDLGPTVLHYFGLPVPTHYEGRVLSIFSEDSEPAKRDVSHEREKVRLDRAISKLGGKI